jgi:uncharacterized delta-60 repeat protein
MGLTRAAAVLTTAAMLVPAGPARAAVTAGSFDPGFSRDGKALVDFGKHTTGEVAGDVIVRSHRKVLTVGTVTTGSGWSWGIARLRGDGTPDRSFSGNGRRTTSFTGHDDATRVLGLPHGGFLVAGSAGGSFALARYDRHGALDAGFGGGDGKVTTDVTAGTDRIFDLRVEPDGSILTAGMAGDQFAFVRYTEDGALDPTFGDGGVVLTTDGFVGTPTTVRMQPDGKLLAAGYAGTGPDGWPQYSISRFDADGALDTTFGTGGRVATGFGLSDEASRAYAILVQPDGRIVVAGNSSENSGDYRSFSLARYLSDGSLDTSFGGANGDSPGRTTNLGAEYYAGINALSLQRDGKIVAAGWTTTFDHVGHVFGVVRYTADGLVDRSFSHDGLVPFAFPDTRRRENRVGDAYGVAVRGGRVVVVGSAGAAGTPKVAFGIARLRN